MGLTNIAIIIAVQIITFLALVLLLRSIMYTASAAEVKRLRELNLENQKKAEKLARDLERQEREHQRKVEKAEAELRELKTTARQESEQQKEELLGKAREESEKIVNQALGLKDRIREELEGEMQERGITLACSLIKGVMTADNMKWFHDGLVNDVLASVKTVDQKTFQGIEGDLKGEVKTPYELSKDQMKALSQNLSQVAGRAVDLKQVADTEVIAGITIALGNLVIDGSLGGKLHQVTEQIAQE
jgi:F0F1-type ATP synthase membrane subunit b/b'